MSNDIKLPEFPKEALLAINGSLSPKSGMRECIIEHMRSYALAAVEEDRKMWAQKFENLADEYQRKEGNKWPEMKTDAETGIRDVIYLLENPDI